MKMRRIILVLFRCHVISAVTHTLKFFYTGSSQVQNFPEFVAVGLVDDVQVHHYDSNTRRSGPKQDWMNRVTEDHPEFWEAQTAKLIYSEQIFKANIEKAKERFNETEGVHILQWMYGCEWDSESGEVNGFHQYGFDGEDFISFDLKTETWVTSKSQAVITKLKLEHHNALSKQKSFFLTQNCPKWLKKYVKYGKSSLLRTVPPSVSVLQKSPSSPVSCHATGFYPDRATMFWRKDGQELHEDVDHGEILPNHDGTFQMRVDLNISSVKPEDWRRYDCVFNLSGMKNNIVTKLNKDQIKTNIETSFAMIISITAVIVLVLICVSGLIVYRKKKAKPTPSPVSSSEVLEQLNPTD